MEASGRWVDHEGVVLEAGWGVGGGGAHFELCFYWYKGS